MSVPFASTVPEGNHSMGVFLGLGDQSNYLKLVLDATNGNGGLLVVFEENYSPSSYLHLDSSILTAQVVDLYININLDEASAQVSYSIGAGARTDINTPISMPRTWIDSVLAIGFISTSKNATPFTATWNDLEVYYETITAIKDIDKFDFKMFPNPSTNYVNIISSEINVNGLFTLKIENNLGQILFKKSFKNPSKIKQRINVENFPRGVYFLKLSNYSQMLMKPILIK